MHTRQFNIPITEYLLFCVYRPLFRDTFITEPISVDPVYVIMQLMKILFSPGRMRQILRIFPLGASIFAQLKNEMSIISY